MIQKESINQLNSISLCLQGFVTGLVLTYPALLSLDVFGLHFGLVFLPVAAIYFWPPGASYSWSFVSVFVLGLIYDVSGSGPLGMWTLSLLIVFLVIDGGNRKRTSFLFDFGGFILSVFLCLAILFLVGRFSLGQWPSLSGLFVDALASFILFPVLYWIGYMFSAVRGPQNLSRMRR